MGSSPMQVIRMLDFLFLPHYIQILCDLFSLLVSTVLAVFTGPSIGEAGNVICCRVLEWNSTLSRIFNFPSLPLLIPWPF